MWETSALYLGAYNLCNNLYNKYNSCNKFVVVIAVLYHYCTTKTSQLVQKTNLILITAVSWVKKSSMGRKLQFSDRQPTAKLVLKSTKDFHFEFSYYTHRRRLHGARGARAPQYFAPGAHPANEPPPSPNNSHAKLQSMITKRSQNLGKKRKLFDFW